MRTYRSPGPREPKQPWEELYSLSTNQQSYNPQRATTVNDADDRQCPEISNGCSSVYAALRIPARILLIFPQKYNSNVVKRLPEGPLFSKEAVRHLSPPHTSLVVAHSFSRLTCLISTHTNTPVWLTPRCARLRISQLRLGTHDGDVCRPSPSGRIRVSSRLRLGNRGPHHMPSALVSLNRHSVIGQAQGGPSEPPQNSSNPGTGQISAG